MKTTYNTNSGRKRIDRRTERRRELDQDRVTRVREIRDGEIETE